jgi:cyclic dehypoxanthinyl futalosine synthase
VRQRISPLKAMSDDWLEVMDVAHRLGLASSATMMFGHVETIEDRIEHLERLRAQQDKSKGVTAFICWTFQAEHTKLKAPTVGAHEYLRTQALARIYLDNFTNVQSSWVTQGLDIGQIALKYGANDLGSIMIEENVVSQAGTTFRMGVADMKRLICDLGYEPHQRDNWYRLLN